MNQAALNSLRDAAQAFQQSHPALAIVAVMVIVSSICLAIAHQQAPHYDASWYTKAWYRAATKMERRTLATKAITMPPPPADTKIAA